MGTNFKVLGKGLKQLGILLFLLILSPILLSLGFKALSLYNEGSEQIFSWVLVVVAGILMLFTIYYAFRTFKTILNSLFHEK